MNFDLSDDQRTIKRTAREFLAARYPLGRGAPARARGRARLDRRAVGRDRRAGLARDRRARDGRDGRGGRGARLRARADAAAVDVGGRAARRRHRPAGARRAVVGRRPGAPTPAPPTCCVDWDGGGGHRRRGRAGARARSHAAAVPRDAAARRCRAAATSRSGARPGDGDERRRVGRRRASGRWRWRSSTPRTASSSTAPIGTYQAVSHACAQMLLEVEGARSAVYWAAWALDHEPETAPLAVAMREGLRGRRGPPRPARGAAGPRRHRLHLGARPALLPQARRGERPRVRRRRRAPRARRGPDRALNLAAAPRAYALRSVQLRGGGSG